MKGRPHAHDIIRSSRISSRTIQIAATMDEQNKHEVATRGAWGGQTSDGIYPSELAWGAAYRGLRHVTLRHHPHPFNPEGRFGWNPVALALLHPPRGSEILTYLRSVLGGSPSHPPWKAPLSGGRLAEVCLLHPPKSSKRSEPSHALVQHCPCHSAHAPPRGPSPSTPQHLPGTGTVPPPRPATRSPHRSRPTGLSSWATEPPIILYCYTDYTIAGPQTAL